MVFVFEKLGDMGILEYRLCLVLSFLDLNLYNGESKVLWILNNIIYNCLNMVYFV